MVTLDYYHAWYNRGPDWHRSIGVLLVVLLLARMVWRLVVGRLAPVVTHTFWERRLGGLMHHLLDIATLLVIVSGYLISSADGKAVMVFDWFAVPAIVLSIEQQETLAGQWHEWLAWALVVLAGLHALAAVKHHVIDRDVTLRRMLWLKSPER